VDFGIFIVGACGGS